MRYDKVYQILAKRAVEQGGLNIKTFVELAKSSGMSEQRIGELLMDDLNSAGPIFGKFFRDLTGASKSTIIAASQQGEALAVAVQENLMTLADMEDAANAADPEALATVEDSLDDVPFVWVAALKRTCHLCLPLHGVTRTQRQWRDLGLQPGPGGIHDKEGWGTPCYCHFVRAAPGVATDELQPLRRAAIRTTTGLKGSKKTVRAMSSEDLRASLKARDEAMESVVGRRQLRLLGEARADEEGQ